MKKRFKVLIGTFALSTLALFATGCKLVDWVDKEIEQSRCEHVFDSGFVQKEATCTETGTTLYTCAVCGETELRNVDKLSHTEKIIEKVSPTCTESGLTSGTVCEVCDTVLVEQMVIPALGHKTGVRKGVKETCTTAGSTDEEYCVRCDEILTASTVIPATGHNPSVILGYEASCLTYGLTNGNECLNCGEVYTEQVEIEPLGHDYVNEVCTRCSSTTNFLKSLCPNGYTYESVNSGESLLGNIYCLGRAEEEYGLDAYWSLSDSRTYTFSQVGFSCTALTTTTEEQSNALIFEVDGFTYVQFPKDKFICTWDDGTYEETDLFYLMNSGNPSSSNYDSNIMRIVPLESHFEQWTLPEDSYELLNGAMSMYSNTDVRIVSKEQDDSYGFELTFDFIDTSAMDEPFIVAWGLETPTSDIKSANYIEFSKDGVFVQTVYANRKAYKTATFDTTSTSWRISVMNSYVRLFNDMYELCVSTDGVSKVPLIGIGGYVAMNAPVGCAVEFGDVTLKY